MRTDFDAQWEQLAEEVMSGMKEWRLQHPKATLREIERALDERLGKMRARMLQDAALASSAADIKAAQEAERPVCAECGGELVERTTAVRRLGTQQQIRRHLGVEATAPTNVEPVKGAA
jgi:hypothetical protein